MLEDNQANFQVLIKEKLNVYRIEICLQPLAKLAKDKEVTIGASEIENKGSSWC